MIRFWSTAIVGLALAGIIHVVALQLIPLLTPQLARERLAMLGGELQFHQIVEEPVTPDLDPAFRYAVCLFDMSQGPVAVEVAPGGDYWGLSFHDRRGGVFYAINNHSAELGRVTLVLATHQEAPRLTRLLEERNDESVVVAAPVQRGYAMLKAMAASPSRIADAKDRLGRARCRKFEPPPPPAAPEVAAPADPPPPKRRRQKRKRERPPQREEQFDD